MSYIIKGILDRKFTVGAGVVRRDDLNCFWSCRAFHPWHLPWGFTSQISTSASVFVGGMVRWLVDRRIRHNLRQHKLTEEQLRRKVIKVRRAAGQRVHCRWRDCRHSSLHS